MKPATQTATSVADLVDRFTRAGYSTSFRAEKGRLVANGSRRRYRPEELVVDAEERYEGDSSADEIAMVFALRSPEDGIKGTYTVPFGSSADPDDAEVLPRLGRVH